MADSDFTGDTLGGFLERVASHDPAPGGGAAAAVSAALAAGLVAMVARFSVSEVPDAPEVAGEADRLRHEALRLAGQDAEAYRAVLGASRLPKDSPDRPGRIHSAIEDAADVPLRIAATAARIATLGSRLAWEGNPNLQGDAVVAVLLVDAAAKGADRLVELNVSLGGLDGPWRKLSAGHVATTTDAVLALDRSGGLPGEGQ